MKQCLMIKTKDKKKFFTYERNLPQLIEFSKTFNAEISIVQILSETNILELEELAPALCEKKSQKATYKVIEVKLKPQKTTNAKKIQSYIKKSLLNGKIVSIKSLKQRFNGLTTACLCNNFKLIRNYLTNQGLSIEKIGQGAYRLKIL